MSEYFRWLFVTLVYGTFQRSPIQALRGFKKLKLNMPTAPSLPRRSSIRVLTRPNPIWRHERTRTSIFSMAWPLAGSIDEDMIETVIFARAPYLLGELLFHWQIPLLWNSQVTKYLKSLSSPGVLSFFSFNVLIFPYLFLLLVYSIFIQIIKLRSTEIL